MKSPNSLSEFSIFPILCTNNKEFSKFDVDFTEHWLSAHCYVRTSLQYDTLLVMC